MWIEEQLKQSQMDVVGSNFFLLYVPLTQHVYRPLCSCLTALCVQLMKTLCVTSVEVETAVNQQLH